MSRNSEDYEERETQKKFFAKKQGYFNCVGCGGFYSPEKMSSYENLCKNCDYDNNKHDKFEKTR